MSKEPIKPGQTFHLPAAQQANMDNLLKVLSSKKATDALTELGKTKSSTWDNIKETIVGLNDLVRVGGIQGTIETQVDAILSPFKNEMNQLITEALNPIKDIMTDINNELSTFIADNKTGAAIGGIAGQIASQFLPGGPILIAIGGLFGAAVQAFFSRIGTLDTMKLLEEAADRFGGDLGDRLNEMLAFLERQEALANQGGGSPGISQIRLPSGRVVRVVTDPELTF